MKLRLNDQVTANCVTGRFTDFNGNDYQFLGKATGKENEGRIAKYIIKYLADGQLADGSSASGYDVNVDIFRALCPAKAPDAREE